MTRKVAILVPVFNDWESLELLLPLLDAALSRENLRADVTVVDDGSVSPAPASFPSYAAIEAIEIVKLAANLGHQRAIACGLVYLYRKGVEHPVVVMDGDGEDRPQDVPLIVGEFFRRGAEKVLFAARLKRSESAVFRCGYGLYRVLHRVLTGIPVRVGNFSVVPASALPALVRNSDVWNHYAAAVMRSRSGYETMPIPRGERLKGKSNFRFAQLVTHGLSAFSVHADLICARLAAFFATLTIIGLLAAGFVVAGAWSSCAQGAALWCAFGAIGVLLLPIPLSGLALIACLILLSLRSHSVSVPLSETHIYLSQGG